MPSGSCSCRDPEQQANVLLATVQDRAMTRAKAEAVAEGTQFSEAQLELVGVGMLAGASEMLTLLNQLGLRGPSA